MLNCVKYLNNLTITYGFSTFFIFIIYIRASAHYK